MGYCHEHDACWQEFAGHSPMFTGDELARRLKSAEGA